MPVTIREIAKRAGVSIATVSRALNDDPLIALRTRKRLKALAEEMQYVPSNLGRALRARKSRLIGFLVSNTADSFNDLILQGVGSVARQYHYGLLVGITEENPDVEREQLALFREKSVDGLILSTHSPENQEQIDRLEAQGIPVVVCDFKPHRKSAPCVRIDEKTAAKQIVDHLTGLGHKRFAYYRITNAHGLERQTLCANYLTSLGLPAPVQLKTAEELHEALMAENRPTAVICYSDYDAIEVKRQAGILGLTIPGDLSVTGFDDMIFAGWPGVKLTTVRQPKLRMGELAAEILFGRLSGRPEGTQPRLLPELIVRETTGPVRS